MQEVKPAFINAIIAYKNIPGDHNRKTTANSSTGAPCSAVAGDEAQPHQMYMVAYNEDTKTGTSLALHFTGNRTLSKL